MVHCLSFWHTATLKDVTNRVHTPQAYKPRLIRETHYRSAKAVILAFHCYILVKWAVCGFSSVRCIVIFTLAPFTNRVSEVSHRVGVINIKNIDM
jgi:hypothetical protein